MERHEGRRAAKLAGSANASQRAGGELMHKLTGSGPGSGGVLGAGAPPDGGAAEAAAAQPRQSQRLMRERARSFAFAAWFLPPGMRTDVATLYAFCRTVDDLVDVPPPGVTQQRVRTQLEAWQRWLAE